MIVSSCKRVKILAHFQAILCVTCLAVCVFLFAFPNFDIFHQIQIYSRAVYLEEGDALSEIIAAGWRCSPITAERKLRIPENTNRSETKKKLTDFLVPNVVHYVWLGVDLNFTFIHYLSFLSAHKYIKPSYIFVYGESIPSGKWWNRTVEDVENIIHVHRVTKPFAPNGKPLAHMAHASDILRNEIMYKFGGIYLDADVIVLKSFDPLRRYQLVMGRETQKGICNAVIIGVKDAPFLRILTEQYGSYTGKDEKYEYRGIIVTNTLAKIFSSLIHIEETSLTRPSWMELDKIYKDTNFNWSGNYAMHVWIRLQIRFKDGRLIPQSLEDIECNNSTIGQMARHVYYGSKAIVPSRCNNSRVDRILTRNYSKPFLKNNTFPPNKRNQLKYKRKLLFTT